jgi:hypothetical protein
MSKRNMPDAIVPETSFVTSLKPILQAPLFQDMAEDSVASVIDRYWSAIKNVFPEAFDSPRDYVIQKTPGIFSLHVLAPSVIELVRAKKQDLDITSFIAVVDVWKYRGSDFWSVNDEGAARFGSMKGFSLLASELRSDLPRLEVQI